MKTSVIPVSKKITDSITVFKSENFLDSNQKQRSKRKSKHHSPKENTFIPIDQPQQFSTQINVPEQSAFQPVHSTIIPKPIIPLQAHSLSTQQALFKPKQQFFQQVSHHQQHQVPITEITYQPQIDSFPQQTLTSESYTTCATINPETAAYLQQHVRQTNPNVLNASFENTEGTNYFDYTDSMSVNSNRGRIPSGLISYPRGLNALDYNLQSDLNGINSIGNQFININIPRPVPAQNPAPPVFTGSLSNIDMAIKNSKI